jgi:Ca2+-binding EF-hand superfamily protein
LIAYRTTVSERAAIDQEIGMIGIGTIISLAASAFQAIQAANRPDPSTQKADQLFSQLDATGKGSIESADLQSAFDKVAAKATIKADQLFSKLDADSDGKVSKEEFSSSINRLAEQLDQHYMHLRMYGDQSNKTSFSQDDLTGLASNIANNFSKADADGDGKISIKEAAAFGKANQTGALSASSPPPAESQNVELMLQVMRLMQAYGTNQATADSSAGKTLKISVSA